MSLGNTHPELTQSTDGPPLNALETYTRVEIARRKAGDEFRTQARAAEKAAVKAELMALGLTEADYEYLKRNAAVELCRIGGKIVVDGYRIEAREEAAYIHRPTDPSVPYHTIESHKERV